MRRTSYHHDDPGEQIKQQAGERAEELFSALLSREGIYHRRATLEDDRLRQIDFWVRFGGRLVPVQFTASNDPLVLAKKQRAIVGSSAGVVLLNITVGELKQCLEQSSSSLVLRQVLDLIERTLASAPEPEATGLVPMPIAHFSDPKLQRRVAKPKPPPEPPVPPVRITHPTAERLGALHGLKVAFEAWRRAVTPETELGAGQAIDRARKAKLAFNLQAEIVGLDPSDLHRLLNRYLQPPKPKQPRPQPKVWWHEHYRLAGGPTEDQRAICAVCGWRIQASGPRIRRWHREPTRYFYNQHVTCLECGSPTVTKQAVYEREQEACPITF